MASALRSGLLASFLCGVTVLLAPGCSQQGEGERCERVKTQNSDCDSGLVCVPAGQLLDASTDRCCPATPGDESDARCRRKTGTAEPGTGAGGSGEQPSRGGESSGGAADAATSEPNAGGSGGASQEPSAAGQPSAGASANDSGGAPAAAGVAGAGGA